MVDLDILSFGFHVNISLIFVMEWEFRRLTLAEQMTFEIHTGLYVHGPVQGNGCQESATALCLLPAVFFGDWRIWYPLLQPGVPGTNGKTCRKVGAHEREKQKAETAVREYNRTYNRLKARKRGEDHGR